MLCISASNFKLPLAGEGWFELLVEIDTILVSSVTFAFISSGIVLGLSERLGKSFAMCEKRQNSGPDLTLNVFGKLAFSFYRTVYDTDETGVRFLVTMFIFEYSISIICI